MTVLRKMICLTCLWVSLLPGNWRRSEASELTPWVLAQLRYHGGNDDPRPQALLPFLSFLSSRTSVEIDQKVRYVRGDSKDLFSFPFLIWVGDRDFSSLSDVAVQNLRRYLQFGGFLFIDHSQATPGHGFDLRVRSEMKRIVPDRDFQPLPPDHTIYRSFYLLQKPSGRLLASPHLEGITIQGRTVVIYSQNDLLGAWSRDQFGNYEFEVTPGGLEQRKLAFRLGVNLVMYALCDDYKKDTLHVEYILKRRRRP